MSHHPATTSHRANTQRLIFPALLALVLGTALQLQQAELWTGAVYAGWMGLALLLFMGQAIRPVDLRWRAAVVVMAMTLLGFAFTGWRAASFIEQALNPALEGRDITVTGVVVAMPQRHEGGLRFRLALESAQMNGQTVQLPPRLDLGWYKAVRGGSGPVDESQRAPATLTAGDRWQMTVRLKAPHGGRNPHGFDFELWLWEQGVQATGYVRAGPKDAAPQRLAQTWQHPVERARQRVRDAIFERLLQGDADDPQALRQRTRQAGVVAALVVGDQQAIERADWDVFRATGVAHLMSISGLHVTMFAWAATALVGWLWRRSPRACLRLPAPTAGLLGGLLLATSYAVFSGWGVPSQRTVWMLATVALLRLSGRRWPWPIVWMLACAVVVALDPWALLQAGFWLSFVAVGVLFATDSGASHASEQGITARLTSFFREQWVITLALTPLTLLLFGQVSLIGLLANALAIPWVTLVVTPVSLAGVVWAPLWDVAAGAVQGLNWVLAGLAALPLATVSVAQAPLWAGVAGLGGGLLLAMPLPRHLRWIGLPLILPVLMWQAPRPAEGQFELLAVDIGQGNAVLVHTAHHALLYAAGPRYSSESDAGHRVLVPLLRALDVRLDRLVLSHRDSDHTGGAPAVLAMQPQADLLSSIEDGHSLQALRPAKRCEAGQTWVWDGVQFEVLHPQAQDYEADKAPKPNAVSCVLRVSNGTQTALLVGDIEAAQEASLVRRHTANPSVRAEPVEALQPFDKLRPGQAQPERLTGLQADELLVPHHGSKTSSTAAFLDAVNPKLALVQAGYRNRFGHPAAPVMARYAERGIQVIDSAHCGAAQWRSVQPQGVVCQREQGRRYWHHSVP